MDRNSAFDIAVLPGDGIGVEVMDAALAVLAAVQQRSKGFELHCGPALSAGAGAYRATGVAMSDEVWRRAEAADAILFGAMGLPDVRYPDGTEIAPQLDLRVRLELYAGVRPIKALPGGTKILADPRAADIDLVIIRESTEGLFKSRGKGVVEGDRRARDTLEITRATSERLFDFAFKLAEQRKTRGRPGKVTCVDKANVFVSFAFFRKIFDERARHFPHLVGAHHYVDAAALDLVRRPWEFDVLVTENMFGDILSDLGAALIGGMGMAPSGDVGDRHGLFQPAHGSAPDIAGQGIASPIAMIQSAAMMLDWLGQKHALPACHDAAQSIEQAVAKVLVKGEVRPVDLGGKDGTHAVTRAVLEALNSAHQGD